MGWYGEGICNPLFHQVMKRPSRTQSIFLGDQKDGKPWRRFPSALPKHSFFIGLELETVLRCSS